jgi:hypothetical protein
LICGSKGRENNSTAVTASERSLQEGDTSGLAGRGWLSLFTAIHDPPAQLEEEGPAREGCFLYGGLLSGRSERLCDGKDFVEISPNTTSKGISLRSIKSDKNKSLLCQAKDIRKIEGKK